MERYFAGEEFSDEELIAGIRQGVKDLVLAPVFCGTAATGIGSYALLKGIADYMPSPDEKPVEICEDEKGELIEINCTPNGSTCAFVFKTVADQYGRFSYFKVMSGEVKQDMTLVNKRADPPGIDPELFPNAPQDWHWTGTANIKTFSVNAYKYDNVQQGNSDRSANQMAFTQGWAVDLSSGEARGDIAKSELLPVRLVRPRP